jgi:hypothetical protein
LVVDPGCEVESPEESLARWLEFFSESNRCVLAEQCPWQRCEAIGFILDVLAQVEADLGERLGDLIAA